MSSLMNSLRVLLSIMASKYTVNYNRVNKRYDYAIE